LVSIFNKDFKEFIQCLNDQKVKYLLVGGYSVVLHGYSRTTGDLDIWVKKEPSNYERLNKAFRQFRMPVFDMTLENFLNSTKFDVFTFGRPPVAIDIMTAVKGLDFDGCWEKAEKRTIDDVEINIIHINHLLEAKRASGRPKDQDDIDHLTANE
jgi:hypothetical protein